MSLRKPLTLQLSPKARQDFIDILRYTGEKWGQAQLLAYRDKIDEALQSIARNPQVGHRRSDLPATHLAYVLGSHIIVYRGRSMSLNRSTSLTLRELARRLNPTVRGWVNYYGAFYPEPLKRFLVRIDLRLGGWARNKYKRLRGHKRQSWAWLKRCRESLPQLFAHWDFCFEERRTRRAV